MCKETGYDCQPFQDKVHYAAKSMLTQRKKRASYAVTGSYHIWPFRFLYILVSGSVYIAKNVMSSFMT